MNMKQALAIFWSRRTTILVVFLAALSAAATAAYLLPSRYMARAQLFVNLADPNAGSNAAVSGAGVRSYISTQVEALRSSGTAAAVAVHLGMTNDPLMKEAFLTEAQAGGDFVAFVAGRLSANLEVARQGLSDIITINYRSGDPESAARIANAFAEVFVERDIELRNPHGARIIKSAEEQLQKFRARLAEVENERSQLRLAAIRRGDVDATGNPDPLTAMTTVLANARNAVVQARTALELVRSGQNPPPDNPEILALRKTLSEVDLALNREAPRLGAGHRRILSLEANAAQLKAQITSSVARLRTEMIADRERELAAAERRVQDAANVVTQDETQRHDNSRDRAAATALDRELDSLKAQIDQLLRQRERASIANASSVSNVTILARATPPTSPAWPRIPLMIAIAGGLGLAFGFALAFLREMLDRRVRCVDDLGAYVGAPVLGHIGRTRLSSGMTKFPAAAEQRRSIGGFRGKVLLDVSRPVDA
jgi:polysaccharide biosynthesis transport protein